MQIIRIAAAFAFALLALSAQTETPSFESINLWNAGIGSYATYRIPGIIITKRGTLLAYAAARTAASDWANIDIVLRRSIDGGHTWSPSRRIAGQTIGVTDNPVAISDNQTGDIHFLFQRNYDHCFYMRSHDDGKTFTTPIDITSVFEQFRPDYDWHVLAPGVGHAIQLRNGRLLVPVWLSLGALKSDGTRAHGPSIVATIYSDDHGRTWHRGDIVANDDTSPNESMAVQLSDDRVMINMRTASEQHRRLISTSPDGISHWSKPAFDDQLFDPICAASILASSALGTPQNPLLLFTNPDSENIALKGKRSNRARQNLTLRTSTDNGTHWQTKTIVDPGVTGYSDMAVSANGTIYVLYEGGAVLGSETNIAHLTLPCLLSIFGAGVFYLRP